MKKNYFLFSVAIIATALLISCGGKCDKNDPTSKCYEDPALVDAGVVINGIKWATRNVDMPGTFAATPESSGMFYQWNRKIGWSSTNPIQNSNGGSTWDTSTPAGTSWTAAHNPCPQGWRVPTHDEQLTLLAEESVVSNEWTSQNSVNGILFTDKVSNKKLFLPAVGRRLGSDGTLGSVGSSGLYWNSTQTDEFSAYYLYFRSDYADWFGTYRSYGLTVRCVAE